MRLGAFLADEADAAEELTGGDAGRGEDHIAGADHILHRQHAGRVVDTHQQAALYLKRPLGQQSSLQFSAQAFQCSGGQHTFRCSAGAHVQIDIAVRQCRRDGSGHIAMAEQLDAYSHPAQGADQPFVPLAVEYHYRQLRECFAGDHACFAQRNLGRILQA
ncbi:hypothetical protein D3C75_851070 [compost metagenome]